MSSGLVASMTLPAQAMESQPESSGPVTASIPVIPAADAGQAFFTAPAGGMLALPADLVIEEGAVAAPAAATVDFDGSQFSLEEDDDAPRAGSEGGEENQHGDRAGKDGSRSDDSRAKKPAPPKRKDLRRARADKDESKDKSSSSPKSSSSKKSSAPAGTTTSKKPDKSSTAGSSHGSKAVSIAFRYQGTPYLWGGTSPRGFDCSGFVKYVYNQLGKDLGRTVAAQRGDVKFLKRSQAKPGDLVFMGTGHVGIYLGNNRMIDAPRRGKTIQPREIYTSNVQFGRVV